jgi:hypothetical protein
VWMFPPPEKINFPGTFGEARTACKERMRWLLVNIQVQFRGFVLPEAT